MKHQRFFVSLSVFAILFCLVGTLAFPQRLTGILRGTVKDEQGELLPGVTVEIASPSLIGGTKSTVTSATGTFLFASLTPGKYEAKFSLTGFQGIKRENIVVSVDKTITVDIVLKQAGIEETVNVIGAAPVVDVTKSGTSTTYDQQLLENLPKTRFTYIDIMAWAPGISLNETGSEEWHSSFGSAYSSDNYLVDGVDTSFDANGTTWVWNNPDIYQEGEVVAIGAPAEYGDFQGAVVNVVTKSGGNAFHAELNTYVIPTSFVSNNVSGVDFPADLTQYPFHIKQSSDLSFEISGPIKKDKIWFYSNFQRKRYDYSQLGTPPDTPTKAAYDRGFAKFTFQLNKSNKLVVSYQHEKSELPDVISVSQPYDACPHEPGYYGVPNIMLTSILGKNTIMDLKLGGWAARDNWLPMDGKLDESAHIELSNGYITHGIYAWSNTTYVKIQANASISHFADEFIKGSHQFKAGVQFTRFSSKGHASYSGGVAYYDYYGQPYYAYRQNPYNYFTAIKKVGAFFDDAWEITNRLTLNLGLRVDHQEGDILDVEELGANGQPTGQTIKGINNAINWNTVSPRLGFVYQLTSDKKTILRASYGYYYDGLAMNTFSRINPSVPPVYGYWWNPDTQQWELQWSQKTSDQFRIGDVKNSLCRQLSFGLTRELFTNLSLELTYIYKYTNNFNSWYNTAAQYAPVSYFDDFSGQAITVYNQTTDRSADFFTLLNPPDYKQKYQGFIVAVSKRLSNNWQMSASYVLSKAYGVSSGTSQLNQSAWTGNQNPNQFINNSGWDGLLQSDRTHMFKLQGTYFLPFDFSISANFMGLTGKPLARTITVLGLDQGKITILAEPRGSKYRLDDWYNLDLRVEKRVQFSPVMGVKIAADLFNVLNTHSMTQVLATIGNAPGFMDPAAIVPPRRVQLAIRLYF